MGERMGDGDFELFAWQGAERDPINAHLAAEARRARDAEDSWQEAYDKLQAESARLREENERLKVALEVAEKESAAMQELLGCYERPDERCMCDGCVPAREALSAIRAARWEKVKPVEMELPCPKCGALHLDEGEWATRPHHKHLCGNCGHV